MFSENVSDDYSDDRRYLFQRVYCIHISSKSSRKSAFLVFRSFYALRFDFLALSRILQDTAAAIPPYRAILSQPAQDSRD